jgi:hypothetical protein
MEVTQRLQVVQDKAYTLFEEIEGQGSQLEQVVAIVEQHLERLVTKQVIQEFSKQEALAKQQLEVARGLRSGITQIIVTWDKSQVSVGGLLALDQVLRKLLFMFDHFLDFDRLVEAEIGDRGISPILWDFWALRAYVTGMGCRPMVLPMIRPFFNV